MFSYGRAAVRVVLIVPVVLGVLTVRSADPP
jgi:hypothetical protein